MKIEKKNILIPTSLWKIYGFSVQALMYTAC